MIPVSGGGGGLLGLTRDGAPVATSVRTVKGVDYAVFDAAPGAYVASYSSSGGASPGPPPPASASSRDRKAPRVKLLRRKIRASKKGVVVLRIKCPRSERRCLLEVKLRHAGKRLAKAKFMVAGGKTAKLRLKLPRKARARLAQRGSMKAIVVIKARDAAGNRRTTRTRVKLLAPR
jgi:hypothetical protein